MKKTMAVLLLVSAVLVSKAQDKKTEVSLKAYTISNFNLYELGGGYSFTGRWTFDPFQIGVSWKKNRISQEVLLTSLTKGTGQTGSASYPAYYNNGGLGLAYQAGYNLIKPGNTWGLTSGLGLNQKTGFNQTVFGKNPDTQTWADIWTFQFKPYVFTELSFGINEHWGLNLTPYYNLLDLTLYRHKYHENQKDWTVAKNTFETWFPKQFSVRLGCSYTL